MKNNYWLWLIALLVVNSGWYFVSQQSAMQEINRPGADFSDSRDAELSSIFGNDVDYEIEHCFNSVNGSVQNVSLNIKQDSKTLYTWEGTTEDGCIIYSSTASEGEITVNTLIEEGVETTTSITTWPMKSGFVIGALLFSIGTVTVAFGESVVRFLINKRKISTPETVVKTKQPTTSDNQIWQEPIRPN